MNGIQELYEAYHTDVFRYLLSLTRNEALAEDLMGETFCTAISALSAYRGEGSVKNWLLKIARNKWLDHLRREVPVTELELTAMYIMDTRPGPEQRLLRKDAALRAAALLNEEPPQAQKVVKMRIEGYAFSRIAESLQIREGSARVIDFRTRRKIREKMMQEGYDGEF